MPRGIAQGDPEVDPSTGPDSGSNAVNRFFEGQTLTSRWVTYQRAGEEFLQRPLFGNGANSFGQTFTTTADTPGWISNVLLMALHDTGIVGLTLLLAWLGLVRMGGFHRVVPRGESSLRTLVLAVGIGLLCLFVTYQVTTMLWFGFIWWYFAMLGVGAAELQTETDRVAVALPLGETG